MKKLFCTLLAVLLSLSAFMLPASAANSKTVYLSTNRGWSSNVTCTLSKNWLGKAKNGTVRASIPNWGVNVDIRMKNGSKVVWSQNNAITGNNRSAFTYRDFSLGNNYKYYNLQFRTSRNCMSAPYVKVTNIKNVSIS